MGKFWTPQTEKISIATGMGITAYSVMGSTFTQLPALPGMVTAPLVGGISLLTVAAGLTAYGVYVLMAKF